MTSWRKSLTHAMTQSKESWKDVISHTLTEEELDVEFDDSYGSVNGSPFTLWTPKRVYFPYCYDGAEGVSSVPREPCDEKTDHVGGG